MLQPGPKRRILLCADDYGLAPGVDAAIRELLVRGRLSATSVMALTPTFGTDEASALTGLGTAARRPAIGLHVTLTTPHRPLAADFRRRHGDRFPSLAALMALSFTRRLDAAALSAEIRAQFAAFAAAFGHGPDFVDGHQHVQLLPQVSEALLDAVKDLAPSAWVRQCGRALPWSRRLADRKGLVLDVLSCRFRRLAAQRGIAFNPAFAGTYDFDAAEPFAARFPRFLDHLPDNSVVMCHPGRVDAELVRLDPLTAQREEEFAYFASDDFAVLLAQAGVSLA
jgi:chitin disaccharide deacetylase